MKLDDRLMAQTYSRQMTNEFHHRAPYAWQLRLHAPNGCLIANAWNPTGCRASIITDARMQERRCRSQPPLGTNTRLEDKTMRVQWHIHKKWLTKIQWVKSSQMRLSRIHAVLTATCHTRVVTMAKGWHLRTNGEWHLSTSCTSPMEDGKAQAHWTDKIDRFNLTGLA